MPYKNLFPSLNSSNYKLFTIGQFISNIGFLIENIALSWLVYRLTDSAMYIGILVFIGQITIFFTSPFSGILADRFSRHKLLILTNIIAAFVSFILGLSVLFNVASLWFVFATQIIVGFARGIDNPIRNTFVNDLIDKPEHLVNAISFNSCIFNIAKIIGPSLAAILIPWAGEGICFILNSISFISFIWLLYYIKLKPQELNTKKTNVFYEIREGFNYSFNYSPIRSVIVFVSLIGLLAFSLYIVLPVYSKLILKGGADTYGYITMFSGIGALAAALYLAAKKNALGFDFLIFIAGLIYSLGYMMLSFVSNFVFASIIMIFIGFGQVLLFAAASSILQTLTNEKMLGRVYGLYFMFFMACTTIGSLMVGKLTDLIGPSKTFLIISGLTFFLSMAYSTQIKHVRRKSFRRFISLGIDPVALRKVKIVNGANKIRNFYVR